MPGITAVYNKREAAGIPFRESADAIAAKMFNRDDFLITSHDENNEISVRITHRKNDYYGLLSDENGVLAWYGRPFFQGELLSSKNALEILSCQSKIIPEIIKDISGHFQLLIYNKRENICFAVCDKISAHPFYYTETADYIALSPEVLTFKALKKYGWNPCIDNGAVFQFIASGFLWGDNTFWKEAKRLAPGYILKCSPEGEKLISHWSMTFQPVNQSRKVFIEDLAQAIEADMKTIPGGKSILTLSGGYDSRGLLGLMKKRDADFDTVSYTYGLDFSPDSDAGVGKYFADKLNVNHIFHKSELTEPDVILNNLRNAVIATGGETDTAGSQDALLGESFYRKLAAEYDYMARGDEVWGWSDHAVNSAMAFWECSLLNLDEIPQPANLMKYKAYSEALIFLEGERRKYADEYKGRIGSFDDLKDFVYWRHREARLLQNTAYYRRCYLAHIAPFLLDNTLEVIRRLPPKFRVNKNLFMSTMKILFPELFLDKNTPHPYGTKINKYVLLYQHQTIRDFFQECLVINPPRIITDIYDYSNFPGWVEKTMKIESKVLSQKVNINIQPNPVKKYLGKALQRNQFLRSRVKALMVKTKKYETPAWQNDRSHLLRLAMLAIGLKEYESD